MLNEVEIWDIWIEFLVNISCLLKVISLIKIKFNGE